MSGNEPRARLTSIIAIDQRGAIGCDNHLPWRLKTDLAFFRRQTVGNTVIMGRKTYQSIGGKCLPRRSNVVLSHNNVLFAEEPECRLALSVDEALFIANHFGASENFVIGGAQTYGEFHGLVDRYLLTAVHHEVEDADARLSDDLLDEIWTWPRRELATHPAVAGQDEFAFTVYEMSAPESEKRVSAREQRVTDFIEKLPSSIKSPRRSAPSRTHAQDAFAFF